MVNWAGIAVVSGILLYLLLGILGIVFTLGLLLEERQVRRKVDGFVDAATRALRRGNLQSLEQANLVLESVPGARPDLSHSRLLAKSLKKLVNEINLGKHEGLSGLSEHQLSEFFVHIQTLLKKLESDAAFEQVDTEEALLLKSLDEELAAKESKAKIRELLLILRTKQAAQKKQERINKWSVPLAIIGIVLAVIQIWVDLG